MSKVPNIKIFKVDHEADTTQVKLQFEAQLPAFGIGYIRKIQMLLCHTQSSAFRFISQKIINQV